VSSETVGRGRAWLLATRPQTLPAAAAPVAIGTGLALGDGVLAPLPALAALVGAALIQVGTNLANDYFDAVKGADTEAREGFTRVTAGGLLPPASVRRAAALVFAAAVVVGGYLVLVGGVPILVVGVLSVVSGVAYTGGPYPLGYLGLGDLFVFVFFGLVAVAGTYYVQAVAVLGGTGLPVVPPPGTVPPAAVLAGLGPAALSTNVLVVNNLRDRAEDARTGKRTLAVRLGVRFVRAEFLAMLALAYLVPVAFAAGVGVGVAPHGLPVLAPLVTLPLAAALTRTVLTETGGDALNPALERAGRLLAAYALLLAAGLAP
jgi:1,4-dihydroxy-2-naphthoate octaprenyltransferase